MSLDHTSQGELLQSRRCLLITLHPGTSYWRAKKLESGGWSWLKCTQHLAGENHSEFKLVLSGTVKHVEPPFRMLCYSSLGKHTKISSIFFFVSKWIATFLSKETSWFSRLWRKHTETGELHVVIQALLPLPSLRLPHGFLLSERGVLLPLTTTSGQ